MPPPKIGLDAGATEAFRSSASGLSDLYRNLGGSPDQFYSALGNAAATGYGSTLDFHVANAKSIDEGYRSVLGSQVDANDALGRGYTDLWKSVQAGHADLSGRVLGGLEGAGAAERQRIADSTAAAYGRAGQGLVNRGLGNSTVVDSVNRGIAADEGKAYIDLAERLMQQRASVQQNLGLASLGAQQNLGLAGLGQQERGQGAVAGIGLGQLGWLNSISAPYADMSRFASLAQQYGAAGQAQRDREAALAAGADAGRAYPQSAGTVSRGGGGFFTQPADFSSGGTYQPHSYAPPPVPARPPMGAVRSMAEGNAAKAYFESGLTSPYAAPSSGFSGGFGSYGYGGEAMPYAEPEPGMAVQPGGYGASPYAAPASGFGGGFGGYAPAAPEWGMDLGYVPQAEADLFGY